jgi:hypothetical protein
MTHLMLRWHITCQFDTRRASPAINARDTEALRPSPPVGLRHGAAGHVVASGLRLSGEQRRTQYGPDTCRLRTPAWP